MRSGSRSRSYNVTRYYRAPELILQSTQYDCTIGKVYSMLLVCDNFFRCLGMRLRLRRDAAWRGAAARSIQHPSAAGKCLHFCPIRELVPVDRIVPWHTHLGGVPCHEPRRYRKAILPAQRYHSICNLQDECTESNYPLQAQEGDARKEGPFKSVSVVSVRYLQCTRECQLLPNVPSRAIRLLQKVLIYSPQQRYGGPALLGDTFFAEIFDPSTRRTDGTSITIVSRQVRRS